MQIADFTCTTCKHEWEFIKRSIKESFPEHPECPECGSQDTGRNWGTSAADIHKDSINSHQGGFVKFRNPYVKKPNTIYTDWLGKNQN
jgi:NAD-dependent SIR2 family protein deacetylase